MYRAFGIVLTGFGISEVRENCVGRKCGNHSAHARDYSRTRGLEIADDATHVLGIAVNSERRRAHKVARKDCELSSLELGRLSS